MEITLFIFGILAGWLISHMYSRQSLSDLRQTEENLKKDNESIIDELKKLGEQIKISNPETADQIKDIIHKYNFGPGAEPTFIEGLSSCPTCHGTSLKFLNFGNGPLGVSNAWYVCENCGYKFQTNESTSD